MSIYVSLIYYHTNCLFTITTVYCLSNLKNMKKLIVFPLLAFVIISNVQAQKINKIISEKKVRKIWFITLKLIALQPRSKGKQLLKSWPFKI